MAFTEVIELPKIAPKARFRRAVRMVRFLCRLQKMKDLNREVDRMALRKRPFRDRQVSVGRVRGPNIYCNYRLCLNDSFRVSSLYRVIEFCERRFGRNINSLLAVKNVPHIFACNKMFKHAIDSQCNKLTARQTRHT